MNVTELSRSIEALVSEMRDLTLASGVREATYNRILEVDPDLTVEDLEGRLAFLRGVREQEYRETFSVWRLLPPDIWGRYADFGETKLPEQVLLREARKKLRRAWRRKYGKQEEESAPVEEVNSGGPARGPV